MPRQIAQTRVNDKKATRCSTARVESAELLDIGGIVTYTSDMEKTVSVDLVTVMAIAVIAYAGVNICHEVLGHCTMALLVGTKCRVISSTYIPLATELPTWKYNLLVPAGIMANWIAAFACFVVLRTWKTARPAVRYFLWILMAVNLFLSSTYMAVAPIIKFGDSYILIQSLPNQFFWRTAVALTGAVILFFSFLLIGRELSRLVGSGVTAARSTAWKLVAPAYLTGGFITVASALFSQLDAKWAQLEAAGGTFGLTIWLLLLPLRLPSPASSTTRPFVLDRSWAWIAAGIVTALLFIGVLGRGISI